MRQVKNHSKQARSPTKSLQASKAATYNEFKEFEGQRYTGMRVGRSHKWYYDQGEWKETKITPDEWEINYAVKKRRAGQAPEGSGVPVGTEYHWYILAHQNVTKLNANDYSTSMTGLKFKLAHKRAGSDKWSASAAAQRKRLIKILLGIVHDLEQQTDSLTSGAPDPAALVLGLRETRSPQFTMLSPNAKKSSKGRAGNSPKDGFTKTRLRGKNTDRTKTR